MIDSPHILIIGRDPNLLSEIQASCASLTDVAPVLRSVNDFTQAVEAARSWRPHLAIVEMTGDMLALRTLSEEIRAASPETAVAGAFRPDVFPPDVSESTVLIQALRYGVLDFVRRPVSSTDLSQLFERLLSKTTAAERPLGKIVSFISNKGGVGKSTLAVNTAVGLARKHPERVLLVDGSLQMGVCAAMLDLRPATSLLDAARQRARLDETLLRQLTTAHASGLDLLPAPATALEAAEIDDEVMSRVLTLARRTYDFIVVDTFPLMDRLVMAVLDLSDRVYVVVDNVVPTVLGGARLLELLAGMEYRPDRQRVVLNRFLRSWGSPTARDVGERLQHAISHVVPFDRRILTAANLGEPFVTRGSRWSAAFRALQRLVGEVDSLATA